MFCSPCDLCDALPPEKTRKRLLTPLTGLGVRQITNTFHT